jgi:hypothetical protein
MLASGAALDVGAGEPLPTEFQIFAAGENATTKGVALFDAEAARSVMAAYEAHGVDLMIDLNHDSLEKSALAMRADASDARGWFKLELRADGSLWAVDVRWTPDGERRLREKTQRYISPAFAESRHLDMPDDARPRLLVNVALCAAPATHNAPALVAATNGQAGAHAPTCYADVSTLNTETRTMDPKQVAAAIEAIKNGDAAKALEILEAMVVAAASGGAPPAGDPATESAETPPPTEEEQALAALSARVLALTKCATAGEALTALSAVFEREARADADRATLEASERRGLVAKLVTLGVEFPSTAWLGDPKEFVPVKRLTDEPIAELRARVALHAASPRAPIAPPAADADLTMLSARELAHCKKNNIDPTEFATRKANAVRRNK